MGIPSSEDNKIGYSAADLNTPEIVSKSIIVIIIATFFSLHRLTSPIAVQLKVVGGEGHGGAEGCRELTYLDLVIKLG